MNYKYKYFKFGIINLCPNLNIGHLKNTISSADIYYPESKAIIVLPGNCSKSDIESSSKIKKTYKGGRTISSMINCGLKNAPCDDWNIIIFSKGWMRNRIDIKYSYFMESEKDILFPIISHRNLNFVEENISLMVLHHQAIKEIGYLPDMENLNISKLMWAMKAIEQGYKFKGIVGGRCF